jgi:hypothetical protein
MSVWLTEWEVCVCHKIAALQFLLLNSGKRISHIITSLSSKNILEREFSLIKLAHQIIITDILLSPSGIAISFMVATCGYFSWSSLKVNKIKNSVSQPDMVVHAYNLSIEEDEAWGSQVQCQSGLYSETQSQKTKTFSLSHWPSFNNHKWPLC